MAQTDYGAAAPIADVFKNAKQKVQSVMSVFDSKTQPPPAKVDTSYRDEMLKRANESFQKQSDVKPAPGTKAVSNTKGSTAKKPAAKSTARKKLALKN